MSADPNLPPPPPEPVPPVPGESPIETLPQKRRYKRADAGEVPVESIDPDAEIIVLSSLLQNLLARKGSAAEPAENEARGKINRFVSRKDAPSAEPPGYSPAPTAPETGATPTAPARPGSNGPEAMAAIAFPKFEPRTFHPDPSDTWWHRSGSTWGRGVLYFAFTAGLALAAFLAGRNDRQPGNAPAAKIAPTSPAAVWVPSRVEQLDKIIATEQGGDLEAARGLAAKLQQEIPGNGPLDAYAAMLDTRAGRLNDVEATLSRRMNPGTPPEVAAALAEAQAFNYSRRREFERAADCFGEVVKLRPFDARAFQRWGEALRRTGRLTDALTKFQQTLLRLPVAAPGVADEREYVAFKTRVCQVELGRDAEFKADLDKALAAPLPGGYWLLTGAAVALQQGNLPVAVELLKKAQAVFPPTQFAMLLDDYFFRAFAHHAEIEPFLTPPSPEQLAQRRLRMEYFVDP